MRVLLTPLLVLSLCGCVIRPFSDPLPGPVMTPDQAVKVAMIGCDDRRTYNPLLWTATREGDIWHVSYDATGEAMRKNRVAGYEAEIRQSDGMLLKCDAVLYL